MKLTYRLHDDGDLPALKQLWERESPWGAFPERLWKEYVVDAPFGGVAVTVATREGGEIVGQFLFVPSLVTVGGRQVRAFRPAAPLVASSLRGLFKFPNVLQHPVVAMYTHAVEALRARGDGLLYMVPDARWRHFFRMCPWLEYGSFPLWSVPLPLAAPVALPPGHAVVALRPDDGRIDDLWRAAARQYRAAVVRDARSLPLKLTGATYSVLGVERGGELVGAVTGRRKGAQWLICDVLAADADDALAATLAAACNDAQEQARAADAARPIGKAAVLTTPLMEPVVRRLGFRRDSYDFPVVVHVLDPSLKADVSPAGWYVSAND